MGHAVRLSVSEIVRRTSSVHMRRGTFSLGAGKSGEYCFIIIFFFSINFDRNGFRRRPAGVCQTVRIITREQNVIRQRIASSAPGPFFSPQDRTAKFSAISHR